MSSMGRLTAFMATCILFHCRPGRLPSCRVSWGGLAEEGGGSKQRRSQEPLEHDSFTIRSTELPSPSLFLPRFGEQILAPLKRGTDTGRGNPTDGTRAPETV